jgi:DnaJ-class molecular chaperone
VDHYRTLQVTRDAEPEVIERAYRALSLKRHPDHAQDHERDRATERMAQLNEAYAVLSDPSKRRDYDATLPDPAASAWDEFLEHGLVGLFLAKMASRRR